MISNRIKCLSLLALMAPLVMAADIAGKARSFSDGMRFDDAKMDFAIYQNCVGWWPFTWNDGGTAYDSSDAGHDGTLGAGAAQPTWTTNGMSFDGGDYISMGDVNDMGTNDLTLVAWVKTSGNGRVFCKESADTIYALGVGGASSTAIGVFKTDGTLYVDANPTDTAADGAWHCLAATFDRSANLDTYLDGVRISRVNISAKNGLDVQSTNTLDLARRDIPGNGLYLTGVIDDPMIFIGRVLSSNEIYQISLKDQQ